MNLHRTTLALGLACATAVAHAETSDTWKLTFDRMPDGWSVQGKPFTRKAVFAVVTNADGSVALDMTADRATASLKTDSDLSAVDLNRTPIMRWRWRVLTFPTGADGRDPKKDDQAIGLYISSGGTFSQKSLAYRFETLTPIGDQGDATYASVVKVHWECVRNETSGSTWYTEERNVAEDYKKAFGEVPAQFGLGISCNSQYTRSKAEAQLAWIEFLPASADTNAPVGE